MDSEQLDMLVCLNNGVLRFYNPKKYRNFFYLMDDELGHPLVFEKKQIKNTAHGSARFVENIPDGMENKPANTKYSKGV